MEIDLHVIGSQASIAPTCEHILRSLPQWFGIEFAIVQYARDTGTLPTYVARTDGDVIGFLTLRMHNAFAAEISVMGVLPAWHRRGVGRRLVLAAEAYLREQDTRYLQVKTIGPSCDDPFYAQTRAFYFAVGFRPLEEIKQIWDDHNPCLIMVKYLG